MARDAMPDRERRSLLRTVLGALLVGCVCALLFLVPSAWIVQRGWPIWLAALAGAAAFPLVPVTWHVLRERARKKAGSRGQLTAGDRFFFRLIAVALVAVAPLLLLDRAGVVAALEEQSTWYLDWGGSDSKLAGDRMLRYVPGDANGIIWARDVPRVRAELLNAGGEDEAHGMKEILVARSAGRVVLIVRADSLKELDFTEATTKPEVTSLVDFGGEPIMAQPEDDLMVLVSPDWKAARARIDGGGDAPGALIDVLAGAPSDASIVAAATASADMVGAPFETAWAWARVGGETLRVEAGARSSSPEASEALRGALREAIDGMKERVSGPCKQAVAEILDVDLAIDGRTVRADAEITSDKVAAALFCVVMSSKSD